MKYTTRILMKKVVFKHSIVRIGVSIFFSPKWIVKYSSYSNGFAVTLFNLLCFAISGDGEMLFFTFNIFGFELRFFNIKYK